MIVLEANQRLGVKESNGRKILLKQEENNPIKGQPDVSLASSGGGLTGEKVSMLVTIRMLLGLEKLGISPTSPAVTAESWDTSEIFNE